MKFLKQGVCLALLGAGLAAVPGIQASAAGSTSAADGSLVSQIRDEAQGSVALSTKQSTGKVGFLRASRGGDLMPSVEADSADAAAAKATAYLDEFGAAFGAAKGQLRQTRITADKVGWTITYTQVYQGLPVFGTMLKANVDKQGDLTSVSGYAAPGLDLSTSPRVSRQTAVQRAIAWVKADPPSRSADLSGLRGTASLQVYRIGAIKGDAGRSVLAWVVEVTNRSSIRDNVFIDAQSGKLLNRYSLVHDALERQLDEAFVDDNGTPGDESDDFVGFTTVWEEGDPFPGGLNADQQNLVETAGESYWLYQNAFGYDSYDNQGSLMRTVNNDPRIACPNANWNGITTNYCNGVTSDDVVSHEWGHAYTEYTSGLIYQWQPGALNESYSDVWGETVDLINGRDDQGEGDIDTPRPVGECSTHSPAVPSVTINTPASIAGPCTFVGAASYGPQLDGTGITGDVVIGTDAVEDGGTATDGCSPLDNAAAVAGKIVMVDRGLCPFTDKTTNAQNAGAIAVIIGNREDATISPSGDIPATIPTVTIGLTSREQIRGALAGGETVNVTMKDSAGDRTDSFRWLVAEESPAFGGAIRDMWNPTCYGDPGKVSDAEYKCSTDDGGGVHGNSGVPNHAYALLVDGGTFNGTTVTGIGLDKAANIYWRAQSAHMTPTTDFADFADALETSCSDLVGNTSLKELSLDPENPGAALTPITADDCSQVTAAITATELRTEPTQCNFAPLLAKDAPKVCGSGKKAVTVWGENFEDGLKGWDKKQVLTFAEGRGFPWKATSNVPDHNSKAAFGPAPDDGDCAGGADDISSADMITSPKVKMPTKGVKSPRLTFKHYLATESGYDGGNVKISVNGGGFKTVPASAFVFNAYNTTLFSDAEGNTNPLQGQEAFSGTDGGEVFGSWGQSQINLSKLDIGKGDSFKIRFAIGRDGCGGNDGWYVDDVKVVICKDKQGKQLATKP